MNFPDRTQSTDYSDIEARFVIIARLPLLLQVSKSYVKKLGEVMVGEPSVPKIILITPKLSYCQLEGDDFTCQHHYSWT